MAHRKLTEYRIKSLIAQAQKTVYQGISVVSGVYPRLEKGYYVIKVDQGIKQRMKKGLVLLPVAAEDVPQALDQLTKKGYSRMLIERYFEHTSDEERYLALTRSRDGFVCTYAAKGGIEIESHADSIHSWNITVENDLVNIHEQTSLPLAYLRSLYQCCIDNNVVFLEINPLIVRGEACYALDAACEVDDAAALLVDGRWSLEDVPIAHIQSPEEAAIEQLKRTSSASFSFTLINPDAPCWVLLSGGGASIVLADEIILQGEKGYLANYAEYSGNPSAEEVYIFTQQILSLLRRSHAPALRLLIAGAVANFTNIKKTFEGIIRAIDESAEDLASRKVQIYVRRGGPNQEEGLKYMSQCLARNHIQGRVCGPEVSLPEIIKEMVKGL
jgi:ATP-citrate lyase beta-subunit